MKVQFKRFSGMLSKVDTLCAEAAEFASGIGADRLIAITQSGDGVIVWYWSAE